MHIPRYWSKEERPETIGGKRYRLVGWGHSDESEQAALTAAKERLTRIIQRLTGSEKQNDYDYHSDALREQRLDLFDDEENPFAIVTRNGYGSRVLNTARVMFVDIDVENGAPGFFGRLFGAKNPRDEAMERVRSWTREHGGGFRIYETPMGLRLIDTHKLYDPQSEETAVMLAKLGSDRLYRTLCRKQRCFRARLSAKPWRIGLERCPIRFPEEHTRDAHARWCDEYERKQRGHSACRFLESIGRSSHEHEISRVIAIHDDKSGALMKGRPLA